MAKQKINSKKKRCQNVPTSASRSIIAVISKYLEGSQEVITRINDFKKSKTMKGLWGQASITWIFIILLQYLTLSSVKKLIEIYIAKMQAKKNSTEHTVIQYRQNKQNMQKKFIESARKLLMVEENQTEYIIESLRGGFYKYPGAMRKTIRALENYLNDKPVEFLSSDKVQIKTNFHQNEKMDVEKVEVNHSVHQSIDKEKLPSLGAYQQEHQQSEVMNCEDQISDLLNLDDQSNKVQLKQLDEIGDMEEYENFVDPFEFSSTIEYL